MDLKTQIKILTAHLLLVCLLLTGCFPQTGAKQDDMVPADQIVEALCRLELSDDPSAIMELLGFASEEEARSVLLDGVESESSLRAKSFLKSVLTEAEFDEISEENLALLEEAARTLMGKVSYTTEIESEKNGSVTVRLNLYYVHPQKEASVYADKADAALTEGENMQRLTGNMAAKQRYYHMMIASYLDDIKTLHAAEEPKELSVVCKQTVLTINGTEKTVWMPENRLQFSIRLAQAAIKH